MTGELPGRPFPEYGEVACRQCGHGSHTGARLVATGRVRRTLFPWQQGRHPKNGPRFGRAAEHEEAEVLCSNCGATFFTLSGTAVADAAAAAAPQVEASNG